MEPSQYDEVLKHVRTLSAADRKRLLAELGSSGGPVELQAASILELQGLGKEVWAGVDIDKYLDRERESWDR